MTAATEYLVYLKDLIWTAPLLFFILGVGLYLTILLRGIQFRYFTYALHQAFMRHREEAEGDISHFQSLTTFLAGAIGTGAITGVATGIAMGGLGSLFWMWVTALTGMAVRYAEALLAIRYREIDRRGEMVGGPMEYIGRGVGWRKVAVLFAVFGVFACLGIGGLVQSNAIGEVMKESIHMNRWVTGFLVAFVTGLVMIGGVKSIGRFTAVLVPFMALFYIGGGILIILMNITHLPAVLSHIVTSAFTGAGAMGGFAGSSVMLAMQLGVSRSIFSSEAGMGISSIAAAAAKTDYPGRQALVAMTGVFWATIVVCTVTGLVIGIMDVLGTSGVSGEPLMGTNLAMMAFRKGIFGGGGIVVVGLILFAYSTIVAWGFYGEKCMEYLAGVKSIGWYRILFVAVLVPGAAWDLRFVWAFADLFLALMAIPNMIGLVSLSKVVYQETQRFLPIANAERSSS